MPEELWTAVDDYFAGALLAADDGLGEILRASAAAGLPPIAVSPAQGRLLRILASTLGAHRILEVGTLGGYSTAWLAGALAPGGQVVTCELDRHHAAVAAANLRAVGLADRVDIRVGPAADTLAALAGAGGPPFDLAFVDADKPSNPTYFGWCLRLVRPGGLVVVDNVVRGGAVADPASSDPAVVGVRRLVEAMATAPGVEATAIQTVGSKGYDGLILARLHPAG